MKKRIIFAMTTIIVILMSGYILLKDSENSVSTEMEVTTVEEEKENEIEILSYSYDSGVTTEILLDNKEKILYGLVKVTLNHVGNEPGEFFMLVDSDGNPYVYDGNAEHIPELVLHQKEYESETNLMTYVFSDSIYNIRYALLFTMNNGMGSYTGNVITLFDAEGNPSTY